MANPSVVYQDALVLLFLLILIWCICLYEKVIGSKSPEKSLINYLKKLIHLPGGRQPQALRLPAHGQAPEYAEFKSNVLQADKNIHIAIKILKRASFALLLLFCLPARTVTIFESNAQYYWALLACSIAVYQCIKFLIFEQLEQFDNNPTVNKIIQYDKITSVYEKQAILIAVVGSLFCVTVIWIW